MTSVNALVAKYIKVAVRPGDRRSDRVFSPPMKPADPDVERGEADFDYHELLSVLKRTFGPPKKMGHIEGDEEGNPEEMWAEYPEITADQVTLFVKRAKIDPELVGIFGGSTLGTVKISIVFGWK